MDRYAAQLLVNDGIVVITNKESSIKNDVGIFKINDHNVITLLDDISGGIEFYEKYLRNISNEDGYDEILQAIKNGFQDKNGRHKGKVIHITLVGYDKNLIQKPIVEFAFDGDKVREIPHLQQSMMFALEATLGTYLVSKVYSKFMSLKDTTDLLTYVVMQYSSMHQIGYEFSIANISKNGIKIFNDDEYKNLIQSMEHIDLEIRKDCCDLFINDGVKK